MLRTQFVLTSKKKLTHDVFELVYDCPDLTKESAQPGQYVMFQLAPGLNRSYSLASHSASSFMLIIKRIPDGKGSPLICDAEIGDMFVGMIPLGHFTLRPTPVSKCFIGTGTGFAPLYCQLLGCRALGYTESHMAFIFGVRDFQDVFYSAEIAELGSVFGGFDYQAYLSREEKDGFKRGYVTDWITPESIAPYQEFYICGSPAMVKSAREKLGALGVSSDVIFWEQF